LYNATGAVTPIAAVVFEINNGGTESDCLVLKARVAATAGATPTFYLAVASATTTASYCYLNSTATLEIEEYL
jgi:hypothetical protein